MSEPFQMGLDFPVSKLSNEINSEDEILKLCKLHSVDLLDCKCIEEKTAFLWALSGKESSFGANNVPRFEPAYARETNGIYYLGRPKKEYGEQLRQLYKHYGAMMACSWGPFQIMAIGAFELGYVGNPAALADAKISMPFVIRKLNRIISSGTTRIEEILSAYNTGQWKNPNAWPKQYILNFMTIYNKMISVWKSRQSSEPLFPEKPI